MKYTMFNYFPDADTQAQVWVALGLATPLVLQYAESELQTHTVKSVVSMHTEHKIDGDNGQRSGYQLKGVWATWGQENYMQ